ncbi:hypothetical protein PYW07_007700 [Mythimna separata]|uniref:Reverse transcriptase domain-containing protein n=1 Tax=Mythimna separata TaxID=271217 RepID=A0AAD7YPK5_MYTSE|nr:hypothetical protein PYW07_007700 [Mythimna separata]
MIILITVLIVLLLNLKMINIYYQNVRGLRSKINSLYRNISMNSYDVVIFTETWLVDDISNSELFDGRYLVWRRDRDYCRTAQTRGGGVLIAVRNDLTVVERLDWRTSAEDIWVSIVLKRSRPAVSYNINVCGLYLCKENVGNSYITQLQNFNLKLNQLVTAHPLDTFIVTGDFNFGGDVVWQHSADSSALNAEKIHVRYLLDFFDTINACNLSQFNGERNVNGRLLDLVFSNGAVKVSECGDPLALPVDLHHKPLIINADFVEVHKYIEKHSVNFKFYQGDYPAITSALDLIDWSTLLSAGSLDQALNLFYSKLYELRDLHVPVKPPKRSTHPPWYTSALIKILKEKHKYHRKYKNYGNLSDYHSFSLLRNRAKQLESVCFDVYMEKIETSIAKNPKCFWSYIKSKRSVNSLPNVLHYMGESADSGEGISELFSSYFQSTFQEPDTNSDPDDLDQIIHSSSPVNLSTISVCPNIVFKLLKNLDPSKSGGPDLIPPIFIINCAKSLVAPICLLFERSLKEGIVPKIWKSAFITPVFKKGDKSNIENYRPISKLCLFSKVLERVVHTQVYSAFQRYFGDEQHGFLRRRSTASNLVLSNELITAGMDDRCQVDVIYTDYSKCFDRIDHRVLLQKLLSAGIHGDLFRWFSSYIDNRTQAVVLRGYSSGWKSVPSGVPQGSILGPLLFTIFISDIKSCFANSQILLYADDMKVLKSVRTVSDTELLQSDLNKFVAYCKINKLQLNVSKCFHLVFTRQKTTIGSGYTLDGTAISKTGSIRDLGVIHDSKLLFDDHIETIVKKAFKTLGFITRACSNFRTIKPIKVLYCSLVRSHLEYASQVWNPQYETYKSRIESVQRKFLRYLDFKARQFSVDYEHRCKRYHFLPLYMRRNINDICFLANVANGTIDCPDLLSKILLRTNQNNLRMRPLLQAPRSSTKYRRNAFSIRSVTAFNNLPSHLGIDLFCTSAHNIRKILNKEYFGDSGEKANI